MTRPQREDEIVKGRGKCIILLSSLQEEEEDDKGWISGDVKEGES